MKKYKPKGIEPFERSRLELEHLQQRKRRDQALFYSHVPILQFFEHVQHRPVGLFQQAACVRSRRWHFIDPI